MLSIPRLLASSKEQERERYNTESFWFELSCFIVTLVIFASVWGVIESKCSTQAVVISIFTCIVVYTSPLNKLKTIETRNLIHTLPPHEHFFNEFSFKKVILRADSLERLSGHFNQCISSHLARFYYCDDIKFLN